MFGSESHGFPVCAWIQGPLIMSFWVSTCFALQRMLWKGLMGNLKDLGMDHQNSRTNSFQLGEYDALFHQTSLGKNVISRDFDVIWWCSLES
jgi:hypothetical protein